MDSYIRRIAVIISCILFFLTNLAFARAPRREAANLREKAAVSKRKVDTAAITNDFGILSSTPEGNSVAAGTQWLKDNQNPSGSWGDEWEFADTADVIHTLRDVAPDCNEVADGADWLAWEEASNLEFLARQIIALAGLSGYETITETLTDELLAARNEAESDTGLPNWPEGGWGLDVGYETDCMTTAVALYALKQVGLAGGLAVQNVSIGTGQTHYYEWDIPEDANKVRIVIQASGNEVRLRMKQGSPPSPSDPYFPISGGPYLIIFPDSGLPFTPGHNYISIECPTGPATYTMHVSYSTSTWDTRTLWDPYNTLGQGYGPLEYLLQSQNGDGGWGLQRGVATDLYTTLHVLLALQEYSHYGNSSETTAGMAWLRSQQLGDGSFGYDANGFVVESALAGLCLMGDDPYPFETDTLNDVNFLVSVRDPNGSWNNEFYDTALAILTLNTFNQDPVADAGPDQWVYDLDANMVESVTLDASGSSDIDGTIDSYVWTEDGIEIATGVSPTVEFFAGTHTVQLEVTDSGGKNATDEVTVRVTPPPETIYSANLDADPNWTAEGPWAWGVPTGQGGSQGGNDPTAGYTGSKVYGYNLSGGYENDLPATNLTTQAIDCTGNSSVQLKFRRWLCVEESAYDHASVQVSNDPCDPNAWVTLWENPSSTLIETSWSLQTYDISSIADNHSTVYVRWTMGPTDYTWNYGGWNIDDVEVTGVQGPPAAPGMPDLLPEDDSGVSDTDNITGVELARVEVYIYDERTTGLKVFNGDSEMGQAVEQGGGYWLYQFAPGQLVKGENIVAATAVGLGGYSEMSVPLIINYRPHTLVGDLDEDGVVAFPDVNVMTTNWLGDETSVDIVPPGGDGVVNFFDFASLAAEWLQTELWYPYP